MAIKKSEDIRNNNINNSKKIAEKSENEYSRTAGKRLGSIICLCAEVLSYLLGIACIYYSYVIYMVHSGTNFFMIWDALGLAFIALGLGIRFGIIKRLIKWAPVWLRAVASIVIAAGLILLITAVCCIKSRYSEETEQGLDYIILLGAQVYDNGPSVVLQFRLEAAMEYLNANPDTICIVSGGKGSNESRSEAAVMKEWLVKNGIAKERVIMEDKATSTRENLIFSREFIPEGSSVGLVTNNFHLYRSLLLAEKIGYKNMASIAAGSIKKYEPNNLLRETAAVIAEWIG